MRILISKLIEIVTVVQLLFVQLISSGNFMLRFHHFEFFAHPEWPVNYNPDGCAEAKNDPLDDHFNLLWI